MQIHNFINAASLWYVLKQHVIATSCNRNVPPTLGKDNAVFEMRLSRILSTYKRVDDELACIDHPVRSAMNDPFGTVKELSIHQRRTTCQAK